MFKFSLVFFVIIFPCTLYAENLTRQEVYLMNKMGVRMALKYEKPHIVPVDISPEKLLGTELLDFSGSQFDKLPSWFNKFQNLRKLDLSNTSVDIVNALKVIASSNSRKTLEILDLTSGKSKGAGNVSHSINKLKNLKILNLSYTENAVGSEKYSGICIKNLVEINLEGNDLDDTSWFNSFTNMNLSCMNNLRKINLSGTDLDLSEITTKDFPSSVESLDLTNNNDSELNSSFGEIYELPYLIQLKIDSHVNIPKALRKKLN